MSIEYIKTYYGVSAEIGGRIRYTGRRPTRYGEIKGSRGAYLIVLFDGEKSPVSLHPTWEVEYMTQTTLNKKIHE